MAKVVKEKKKEDFLKSILTAAGDDAVLALEIPEVTDYMDSGAYSFNALISADIYKGPPMGFVVGIAGEEATGKTFFAIGMAKHFLDSNPDAIVIAFDSEGAWTKEMLESRGLDLKRLVRVEVNTIEEFRTKALNILNAYETSNNRKPLFFILDSLGMLSSNKEVADITSGSDKRDMTKNQLIKGMFRVMTSKLRTLSIPMVVTNHVYQVIGAYMPTKDQGGGAGLKYAASTIIFLSKSKDRVGTEVVGNIIKVRAKKSRWSRENSMVEVKLSYDHGLDRYYGLVDFAIEADIGWKKAAKGYEINGEKISEKKLNKNAEKYYTKEVLDKINEVVKNKFAYGHNFEIDEADDDDEETDE